MNLLRFTGKNDQKTSKFLAFGFFLTIHRISRQPFLFSRDRSLSLEAKIVVEQHVNRHYQTRDGKAALAQADRRPSILRSGGFPGVGSLLAARGSSIMPWSKSSKGFTKSPSRFLSKQKCRDLTSLRSPLPSSIIPTAKWNYQK